ncbi:hypothetical protein LCGC14_2170320 [marine sediment metagenome]|uniref:DNA-directed DNA polymerase n=2 Tax=root TaxID=1 RepID=A0A0F9G2Y9_9ZZZZ|nr:MAG: DNA polymerase family X [Marseillevirus LCMAC202]
MRTTKDKIDPPKVISTKVDFNMSSPNDLIIANLEVLRKEAQASKETKDRFRARAYLNAIKAIQGCTYQLQSGKGALQLNGVGKKIATKIQELLDTGKLHQVDELGEEQLEKTKTLTIFANIWGVGPVKAQELWDMGARTIEDIIQDYQHLLNDNQKIGLEYFHDLQKRAPRWQVEEISNKIAAQVRQIQRELGWKVKVRVCGSFRRKAETCGDVDVLLCETGGKPILNELVDRLTKSGLLTKTLGIGPTKYMGITMQTGTAFRIDMETIKEHEWPFALLYFTGSGPFNERQRLVAKKMGYSLSEHGLRDVEIGSYVKEITSERQIFEFLKMKYLAPWDRK